MQERKRKEQPACFLYSSIFHSTFNQYQCGCRAAERDKERDGEREVCSRSLWPCNGLSLSLFKGVCKHKVCLLWPEAGPELLVCYIYIFLRLFLMWQNFRHAVIYQERPHGRSLSVHWFENLEEGLFFWVGGDSIYNLVQEVMFKGQTNTNL